MSRFGANWNYGEFCSERRLTVRFEEGIAGEGMNRDFMMVWFGLIDV